VADVRETRARDQSDVAGSYDSYVSKSQGITSSARSGAGAG
jgi:hypothetical protein